MEGVVQLMRYASLSSKIQTASADVARPMWTSPRVQGKQAIGNVDVQGTLSSHGTWIEYEVTMAGSCAWACNLMSGERCSLDGGREELANWKNPSPLPGSSEQI